MNHRQETDLLGTRDVPAEALWGIHTLRAAENFPLSGRKVHPALIHACGAVKLAAARTNHELSPWDDAKFNAIAAACREMIGGRLDPPLRAGARPDDRRGVRRVDPARAGYAAGIVGEGRCWM